VELRVEIYRYCLIAVKPVHPYPPGRETRINRPSKLVTALLATCKQVNTESAQVLYGENEFRFLKHYGHVSLLHFLKHVGPRNCEWLVPVTMSTPFMGDQVYKDGWGWTLSISGHLYPPPRASVRWYSHKYPSVEAATWGGLCVEVMQRLAELPRLKTLAVVLPEEWKFRRIVKQPYRRIYGNWVAVAMEHARVWGTLGLFCRTKPFVDVLFVGCVGQGGLLTLDQSDI
jgi:hypothetical protein